MSLMVTLKNAANAVSTGLKVHSPEILVVGGVAALITAGVVAVVRSRELDDILEEHEEELIEIHNKSDSGEIEEKYIGKETTKVYLHTAGKMVKRYWPAIALAGLGTAAVLSGYGILHKRYVASVAAYEGLQKAYDIYRGRIREKYGEVADKYGLYGIEEEEITVKDPETGKKEKKTVTKAVEEGNEPKLSSPYAKYFSDAMPGEFTGNFSYDMTRLHSVDNEFKRKFDAGYKIFASDVYEALGFDMDKETTDLFRVSGSWKGHDGGDDYFSLNYTCVPKYKYDAVGNRIDYMDFVIDPNFAGRIVKPYGVQAG